MPTIRDVAAYSGVSVATVSHVVNGTRPVHPATAERVQAAIEALGYRPNTLARGLRRNETGTIGLLVPDNSNPFFAEIARAIEDLGFAQGYSVILCNSDESAEKEAAYVDVLLSKQVDGLILISSGVRAAPAQLIQSILKAGVPCVVVDRELGDLPIDQVLVDNEQGGYLVGRYLVELGHRRIGYIGGPASLSLSGDRLAGFRRALSESGLALDPEAIAYGDFQYGGGEAAMRELLRRGAPLTAIFAGNDRMAIGALGVLRRTHHRVPEDVSVVGFDGIPQAKAIYPSLTTVAQPIAQLAQMSVSLLLERLKKPTVSAPQRIVLPTKLIEGESCSPCFSAGPAKPTGLLNRQLAQVIASLGPSDAIVIGDADLESLFGVPCIDLAVAPGLPALLDVVGAIVGEMKANPHIVSTDAGGTALFDKLQTLFPDAWLETVGHAALKQRIGGARAVVRTGDTAPDTAVVIYRG